MRRPVLLVLGVALLMGGIVGTGIALAATPQQLLVDYAAQAKRVAPAFDGFSAARGADLYRGEHVRTDGTKASCSGCHTADPLATGRSRANKDIAPLAPATNPQRFTDPAQVEKWFGRNCPDVLGRACTAQEKGDFITWLLAVR